METIEQLWDKLKEIWVPIKLILDRLFYHLVSASWFFKLPNSKIIKIEIFYAWMSIASFFVTYGIGRDVVNKLEFTTQFYILSSMWLFGWTLYAGTIFGYKASRKVQEYFWETQLMRFLDPKHILHFNNYPNSKEYLITLKRRWFLKHGVSVEWTRDNSPFWHKIQIVLLLGLAGLGLALGLWF